MRFGSPHHHFEVTDSTNLRAKELAAGGAPSGTVVTAGAQTAGRGRGDRAWTAPAGAALLYSAILRPLDLGHLLLPLSVPVAVCEACEDAAPVRCAIKWPNDIWLGERKLSGILIEARPPEWAVIGVGINLAIGPDDFPADLRWPATSLGHGVTPQRMRAALDAALGRWAAADPELVRERFAARDALRGRRLSWEGGSGEGARTGTGAGIDERGNLLVRGPGGELTALGSGEVRLTPG
ncbi:MAG: biotin--[acetyl-CoA-carboxylase] ligase [Thermoleophilia bacterium]|nr:biotin--[acetyl-CoA-carboxylase] ligase [Thermoleophilia bacterium]